MSTVITIGEISAAAGDAYGASQGTGGLSSPANQASFGAAVAAGASAWASAISSPTQFPFLNGLSTSIAPAASAAQLAINISNLQNPNATPAEALSASLGILGGKLGHTPLLPANHRTNLNHSPLS